MASVRVQIPGRADTVQAKAALMAQVVQHQWNVVTATPQAKPRRPSASNIGRPLTTARLA